MELSEFKPIANVKLKRITDLLEQLHGIQIDWDSPQSYLQVVLEHYDERKRMVLSENRLTNPEYTKSVLITEAIRVYLREIAPHRKKNSRRQ